MQQDGKLTLVGNLGGEIEAKDWFKNLLEANSKDADDIWNPVTFFNYVKEMGRWDYKNLNEEVNERVQSKELKQHIIGIAFYRKDEKKGDLPETYFTFNGESYGGKNPPLSGVF